MSNIETVRELVRSERGAKVAMVVDLSRKVNFELLRDTFIAPTFPNIWVVGYHGTTGGAVIGCRDSRVHRPELARCIESLNALGFKLRKLPGDFDQFVVT